VSPTRRPAVFLDRDGTLIVESYYLADPDRVELVPGSVDALQALRAAGYALVVVTNQSGIALGLYGEREYREVAARLAAVLTASGVALDGTYFCPHHPDRTGPCDCRKPATGMHRRAAAELGLDPRASWYVGDKISDVLPAGELGGRGILVRTGYGSAVAPQEIPEGVVVLDDLSAAARHIVETGGRA
jgi:D-glycero-D-manno-heptose 1,7-bisphosphate phosphatase